MYSTILLIFAIVASALAAELSVNTPKKVTSCSPVTVTWQDGKGPYKLLVVPGDDPCDDPLVNLGQTKNTWLKWDKVNLKAGTKIIFSLEDADEEEVWTTELTVQNGTDTSCDDTNSAVASTRTALTVPPSSSTGVTDSNASPNTPVNVGGAISAASPRVQIAAGSAVAAFVIGAASLAL